MLVKGQIHGGVAQGLGQALMEEVTFDPDSGQLIAGSFMDYAMPRATDLSPIDVISNPVPTPTNPLGVKGVGEAGAVGALSAVMNAVIHALEPLGIRHLGHAGHAPSGLARDPQCPNTPELDRSFRPLSAPTT